MRRRVPIAPPSLREPLAPLDTIFVSSLSTLSQIRSKLHTLLQVEPNFFIPSLLALTEELSPDPFQVNLSEEGVADILKAIGRAMCRAVQPEKWGGGLYLSEGWWRLLEVAKSCLNLPTDPAAKISYLCQNNLWLLRYGHYASLTQNWAQIEQLSPLSLINKANIEVVLAGEHNRLLYMRKIGIRLSTSDRLLSLFVNLLENNPKTDQQMLLLIVVFKHHYSQLLITEQQFISRLIPKGNSVSRNINYIYIQLRSKLTSKAIRVNRAEAKYFLNSPLFQQGLKVNQERNQLDNSQRIYNIETILKNNLAEITQKRSSQRAASLHSQTISVQHRPPEQNKMATLRPKSKSAGRYALQHSNTMSSQNSTFNYRSVTLESIQRANTGITNFSAPNTSHQLQFNAGSLMIRFLPIGTLITDVAQVHRLHVTWHEWALLIEHLMDNPSSAVLIRDFLPLHNYYSLARIIAAYVKTNPHGLTMSEKPQELFTIQGSPSNSSLQSTLSHTSEIPKAPVYKSVQLSIKVYKTTFGLLKVLLASKGSYEVNECIDLYVVDWTEYFKSVGHCDFSVQLQLLGFGIESQRPSIFPLLCDVPRKHTANRLQGSLLEPAVIQFLARPANDFYKALILQKDGRLLRVLLSACPKEHKIFVRIDNSLSVLQISTYQIERIFPQLPAQHKRDHFGIQNVKSTVSLPSPNILLQLLDHLSSPNPFDSELCIHTYCHLSSLIPQGQFWVPASASLIGSQRMILALVFRYMDVTGGSENCLVVYGGLEQFPIGKQIISSKGGTVGVTQGNISAQWLLTRFLVNGKVETTIQKIRRKDFVGNSMNFQEYSQFIIEQQGMIF